MRKLTSELDIVYVYFLHVLYVYIKLEFEPKNVATGIIFNNAINLKIYIRMQTVNCNNYKIILILPCLPIA